MVKQLLKRYIAEVLDGFSMAGSRRMEAPGNMRYDVAVRPNDGKHAWEELETTIGGCSTCGAEPGCNIDCPECMSEWVSESSDPNKLTKRAACVLVVNQHDGRILSVSRRDDPTMGGLPGGKVDPGETPREAAVRELYEETGLKTDINSLVQVFAADDGEYITYTYVGQVTGEINTDESGVIKWSTISELTDPNSSPFADYNVQLFRKLDMIV